MNQWKDAGVPTASSVSAPPVLGDEAVFVVRRRGRFLPFAHRALNHPPAFFKVVQGNDGGALEIAAWPTESGWSIAASRGETLLETASMSSEVVCVDALRGPHPVLLVGVHPVRSVPVINTLLPTGAVVTRLVGWSALVDVCGLQDGGFVAIGGNDARALTVAYSAGPLATPVNVFGGWSHAQSAGALVLGMCTRQGVSLACIAARTARGTLVGMCIVPKADPTAVERPSVQCNAEVMASSIISPYKLLQWVTKDDGDLLVLVGEADGSSGVALVAPLGDLLPVPCLMQKAVDAIVSRDLLLVATASPELLIMKSSEVPLYTFSLLRPCRLPFTAADGGFAMAFKDEDGGRYIDHAVINENAIMCPTTAHAFELLSAAFDMKAMAALSKAIGTAGYGREWEVLHTTLCQAAGRSMGEQGEAPKDKSAFERLKGMMGGVENVLTSKVKPMVDKPHPIECTELGPSHARAAVCLIHLLHESMRVSALQTENLAKVAVLVHTLSVALGLPLWAEHYKALYPTTPLRLPEHSGGTPSGAVPVLAGDASAQSMVSKVVEHSQWFSEVPAPPDLLTYVHSVLAGKHILHRPFPSVPVQHRGGAATASARVLCHVAELRVGHATTSQLVASLPPLPPDPHARVVVGVLHAAIECSVVSHAVSTLSMGAAALLRRSVVACRNHPPRGLSPNILVAVGREDSAFLETGSLDPIRRPILPLDDVVDAEALPHNTRSGFGTATDTAGVKAQAGCRMMWDDSRLAIAESLLDSSEPVKLHGSFDSMADPAAQQQQLAAMANRVLSLPCGRGMLTLSTTSRVPGYPLPQPPIVLCGRRAKDQALTSLDLSGYAADTTQWPEFLNGCSAALRLRPEADKDFAKNWLACAISPSAPPSAPTAGIILGLGLLGHLKWLRGVDVFSLMEHGHEATTVALLLGMAAGQRGTADKRITQMLSMHLTPITPHYTDIEVAQGMQAAAVIGIGLLYQGTCHRFMVDMLLGELSRGPSDEHSTNLHAYPLSAGFALGLVCLCRGGQATHLADLRLQDRLFTLLSCARREDVDTTAGNVGMWAPYVDDTSEVEGSGIPQSLLRKPSKAGSTTKVMVGPLVDTTVTAPGAAVALGLMYHGTGNKVVAAQLAVPRTTTLLLAVTPDSAMTRVIASTLVMWDDVRPTQEWVDSMIPSAILSRVRSVARGEEGSSRALDMADDSDDSTESTGDGTQYLILLHAHLVAGALFGLGLRYAGTEAPEPKALVLNHLRGLMQGRSGSSGAPIFPAGDADTMNKKVIDPCINAAALAASCIMAGTGDLEVFSVLRTLQKRKDATYGSHQAVGMALGLLFLGSGHRSLSSTPTAIASLLISLYPRFPCVATDNSCHPQFLRPFYVMATVPRILETRDVVTGASVPLPVVITVRQQQSKPHAVGLSSTHLRLSRNGQRRTDRSVPSPTKPSRRVVHVTTPCLLPRVDTVESIAVESLSHHRLFLLPEQNPTHRRAFEKGLLFVKRQAGGGGEVDEFNSAVCEKSDRLKAYKTCFGLSDGDEDEVHEAPDALRHAVTHIARGLRHGTHTTWDVRLMLAGTDAGPREPSGSAEALCPLLASRVRLLFSRLTQPELHNAVKGSLEGRDLSTKECIALAWHGHPPGAAVKPLVGWAKEKLRGADRPVTADNMRPLLILRLPLTSPSAIEALCRAAVECP